MRGLSPFLLLLALAVVLVVTGVLFYDGGSQRLGAALIAVGVLGGMLFIAPGPARDNLNS